MREKSNQMCLFLYPVAHPCNTERNIWFLGENLMEYIEEPQSMDFLQARFVDSLMKENIKSYFFMEIALSNPYQLFI